MNPTRPLVPPQTVEYTVTLDFIASQLRHLEYDTHGVGIAMEFQSLLDPSQALRLHLAAADARRMHAALLQLAAQLQEELSRRPTPAGMQ